MKRIVPALLLCAVLLTLPAFADSVPEQEYELYGAGEVDESVPDSAREIIGDAGVEDALDPEGLFERLWDGALQLAGELWSDAAAGAVKLIAVAALCSMGTALSEGQTRQYVTLAGCLGVAAVAFGEAGQQINAAAEAIEEMNSFSHALLPCLTATAAAGGMVTSAAARYAATSLFMDILITLSQSVLLPSAYALLAVKTASAALGNRALDGAGKLLKWLAFTLTTAVVTAFTLWLSLSGAITGATDSAASKAAKTAISAALPVVGGIISNAAGTLMAGASLLKGAVGALGAVVIIAICLAPFISLALRYLLYKAAAALASSFADDRVAGLIGDVGSVFALVLGVTGACAAMLFVSVLSTIKAVGG